MRAKCLIGLAGLAGMVLLPADAFADAIDGDWCHSDGRHMSIHGPNIVTPGGSEIVGNYSRHYFSYVIPQAERGNGQTVSMVLVNELTVNLRIGADSAALADAPVQVWHRCAPTTSDLGAPLRISAR